MTRMTEPDPNSMTGTQFRRTVSADPRKWATQFWHAYTEAEGLNTEEDTLEFISSWFRDAMDAARVEATKG